MESCNEIGNWVYLISYSNNFPTSSIKNKKKFFYYNSFITSNINWYVFATPSVLHMLQWHFVSCFFFVKEKNLQKGFKQFNCFRHVLILLGHISWWMDFSFGFCVTFYYTYRLYFPIPLMMKYRWTYLLHSQCFWM